MRLNDDDRLRVAMALLETVPEWGGADCADVDADEQFLAEIRRRGEDGTASVPWETVRQQARLRRPS